MTGSKRIAFLFALTGAALGTGACGDDDATPPDGGSDGGMDASLDGGVDAAVDAEIDGGVDIGEYEARFLIEHNAADDDTGFQIFFDWDPWATLSVTGPGGDVLEVEAQGEMADYGLTEMFFETNEPPADEMSRDDVLALFPAGDYTFEVTSVEGETVTVTATLTHDIPEAAEILTPAEDAMVAADEPLVVSWNAVTDSVAGTPIDLVAYEVIVGRDLELPAGEGFAEIVLDVTVPAAVTSIPIPAEYLRPGTPYEIEVLALEASGNQTIAATTFETTGTPIDDLTEIPEPGATELAAAKYLIEHNATDEDTGYQIFLDGEPWSISSVEGPAEAGVVEVRPQGNLATFGLTEMFFETNEPEASEVPLDDVLALFPEGEYAMSATAVEDATVMAGTATLSHDIPEATVIASPAEEAEVDSASPLEVSWSEVTTSLESTPIDIVAYQLIVVKEGLAWPSAGFFETTFSVHVPADTTSVTVPAEFLEGGSDYEIEVLAIEETGNQTISLVAFATP